VLHFVLNSAVIFITNFKKSLITVGSEIVEKQYSTST